MPEQLLEEQRENWGSRAGFILAAVGSAVGLGNLWGFPYKVYANGGGAFLIPYLLAMLLIGIPLLILEFSLGHMTQRAAPDAYRGINRRTEPIGWWGILLGFVIITYYPVILAWCGSYLLECFKGVLNNHGELPWAGQGMEGVKKAGEFFENQYLRVWTPEDAAAGTKPWAFGRLNVPIVASLGVMWLAMYLCIFRGVRLVGRVVLWTVPLPWIMLCVLTVRGLTLEGAAEGLTFYLEPKMEYLLRPETWRWAFGQMFFSMSLAFGVMITYASFLHRKSDINNNAAIIGLADVGTSFIAGIAVFATLGAMAFATRAAGQAVPIESVAKGGPGLAFVVFPYALAQLPYSAYFGAVFFIALLTLGIDSAFSITESVLAALVDKTGWNRNRTLIGMSTVGFGLGLVYCTRGGLSWLGAIDSFINDPWGGIALLGLLECVVVGWAYRIGKLREHANERSDWKLGVWWDWIIRYLAPILLSALFTWSVLEKFSATSGFLYVKDELQVPTLVGLILAIAAPVLSLILSFIHSPGANLHAQHVGQPRTGRVIGLAGLVAVLVALGFVVHAFVLTRQARIAGPEGMIDALAMKVFSGYEWPAATFLLLYAVGLALIGTIAGAAAVSHAESSDTRPSGLARLAAGWGVMTMGGAGGVLLSLTILLNPVAKAEKAEAAKGLDWLGYLVLACMLGLLVVGLGWCFYRAVRGSSESSEPQWPDDQAPSETPVA
jgi:neurotransmitter:Na+ symporter, NSS family